MPTPPFPPIACAARRDATHSCLVASICSASPSEHSCCTAGQLLNELVAFNTTTGVVSTLSPLPYGSGDVELVALPNSRLLAIGGLLETGTSASNIQVSLLAARCHVPRALMPGV